MYKKVTDFPWSFGCNFIPSTAINQLEMWQSESFDPQTIDRELTWAASIGMNIVRVYLHDLLWIDDKKGFLSRMEKFLEIADSHKIKAMFVFFDDCWREDFQLGKQPEPIPYTHNSGWIQSPGGAAADDLSNRPRLKEYVQGVLSCFAHDQRIALWDLYNEPGNGRSGNHIAKSGLRGSASLPLLQDVFAWAREVNPDQPITAAPWTFEDDFDELNRFMFENSDVVTFHAYTKPESLLERINFIRYIASGRPVLCSEYMARTAGSTFKDCLPLLRENNVGAINWGLVSGKTQTIYPWNWNKDKGTPDTYFHDVFNADGTFLYPEEGEFFKEFNSVIRHK